MMDTHYGLFFQQAWQDRDTAEPWMDEQGSPGSGYYPASPFSVFLFLVLFFPCK